MSINTELGGAWIIEAWAHLPDDVSMEDFIDHMRELGNLVTEVDREQRKVRIGIFTNDNEEN